MDPLKMDAALIAALDNTVDPAARDLAVFIHTVRPPDADAAAYLEELGVSVPRQARRIFTATLTAPMVEDLSQQMWVRYLRLSQKLDLAPSPVFETTGTMPRRTTSAPRRRSSRGGGAGIVPPLD